jgi:hypothetical protein
VQKAGVTMGWCLGAWAASVALRQVVSLVFRKLTEACTLHNLHLPNNYWGDACIANGMHCALLQA